MVTAEDCRLITDAVFSGEPNGRKEKMEGA